MFGKSEIVAIGTPFSRRAVDKAVRICVLSSNESIPVIIPAFSIPSELRVNDPNPPSDIEISFTPVIVLSGANSISPTFSILALFAKFRSPTFVITELFKKFMFPTPDISPAPVIPNPDISTCCSAGYKDQSSPVGILPPV